MFSLIGSNIIFNIIEYFSFINLFLLFLFIIITLFFILINSTLLYYSNVNCNHCLIEFISTLFSLLFLVIIISPALIILLDFDLVVLPSFIIYSLGLQWAWQFNIIFLPINTGFNAYCDHYIISTDHQLAIRGLLIIDRQLIADHQLVFSGWISADWLMDRGLLITGWLVDRGLMIRGLVIDRFILCSSLQYYQFKTKQWNDNEPINNNDENIIKFPFYLWDINNYILLPIYSFIRLFLYSFDVIHTLGFYSWGIKIDAIPGRINLATTLRLLWKGEYRGKCSESCGQGHLSMIMLSLIIYYPSIN